MAFSMPIFSDFYLPLDLVYFVSELLVHVYIGYMVLTHINHIIHLNLLVCDSLVYVYMNLTHRTHRTRLQLVHFTCELLVHFYGPYSNNSYNSVLVRADLQNLSCQFGSVRSEMFVWQVPVDVSSR